MPTHLPSRDISPLFISPSPSSSSSDQTTLSPTSTTSNRTSLLTLLTSAQNVTIKIHATSHLFTSTVPLSSAPYILPVYLSGVISSLEALPDKNRVRERSRSTSRIPVRRREMRIKVVIAHGLRGAGGLGEGGAMGLGDREGEGEGEIQDMGAVEEIEYLFFGTKAAVQERFPAYLGAVMALERDPWAVERINEGFFGEGGVGGDEEVREVRGSQMDGGREYGRGREREGWV